MKKLFTFLGVTDYEECIYQSVNTGWESSPTRFVQVAVLEMLRCRGSFPDEVVVFLTRKAREKNWVDRLTTSGNFVVGLERTLEERFRESDFGIKVVEIPEDQVEVSLWDLFDQMAEEIGEGDDIYLDISNSFRFIPAISLIISNYMRVLKNMKLRGLYHGVYIKGQSKMPLYDLTEMLALFDWTQAVDDYLRNGSAKRLKEVASDLPVLSRDDNQLVELANRLDELSMIIETCRSRMVEDAIKNTRRQLNLVQEDTSLFFKPFKQLLGRIEGKLDGYRYGDLCNNVLYIVRWCLDHQLYQQGYTFLKEGILSILIEGAGLQWDNMNDRELVQNVIYALTDNGHYQHTVSAIKNSKLRSNYDELLNKWRPLASTLAFYRELNDFRNNINHAQTQDRYHYSTMVRKLEEFYKMARVFVIQFKALAGIRS